MSQSIQKIKKYIDNIDEVYKLASLTSVLDASADVVRQGAAANSVLIPKISMQGLGDYSRASGYVQGDVTFAYEEKTFNQDRGRKFVVDAMDDEETAGVAFGKLASEFIRTQVAPEFDAFRFAKYAYNTPSGNKATGTLSTGANVLSALGAARTKLEELEVGMESVWLFITPTLHNLILGVDTTASREMLAAFGERVVKVPQSRFYTAIDLLDGSTSGEEAGGYAKDSDDGLDINFMLIDKRTALQYTKHQVSKIVSPEENQTSDGWMYFFRSYGLCEAYDNKKNGLYLHSKAS